jgi:hypothetical protein
MKVALLAKATKVYTINIQTKDISDSFKIRINSQIIQPKINITII